MSGVNAKADSLDPLNFFVSSIYTHESNLFRLSESIAQPVSDNLWVVSSGIRVNKPYAMQNFKFDYTFVQNKYDVNDYLNFNANNYRAAWDWHLTPRLKGTIFSDKNQALAGFVDADSTIQNVRSIETRGLDGDFRAFGGWHIIGGITRAVTKNTIAIQNLNLDDSSSADTAHLGLRYIFPSETTIEIIGRDRNGVTNRRTVDTTNILDTGFIERESEAKVTWPVTGKSKLTANYGYLDRIHDNLSQRDFSGWYGATTFSWNVTSRFILSTNLTRSTSSFQTRTDSYVINTSWSLTPTWQLSAKTQLRANYRSGFRRFLGSGPEISVLDREDDTDQLSLSWNWVPRETVQLGLTLLRDERDSTIERFDYKANSVTFSAQLIF